MFHYFHLILMLAPFAGAAKYRLRLLKSSDCIWFALCRLDGLREEACCARCKRGEGCDELELHCASSLARGLNNRSAVG